MAHEIDFTTGTAAIAYRGDTPWHNYGFSMPENAPLDEWLKAAQLNWDVLRRPVTTSLPTTDEVTQLPRHRALMRSDTGDVLSVVSDRYKVVQPREILEFFRDLTAEHGYTIETAGALAGGRRVWALANTGQSLTLGKNDAVNGYLLLATSYDKQFATTAQFTPIRVVCNNTLTWSLNRGEHQDEGIIRVPHCTTFDPAAVKVDLGILEPAWKEFGSVAQLLANTPVSKRQAIEFFMELMGYDHDENTTLEEQAQSQLLTKQLLISYENAPGQALETARDTAWGLVQGVTHFTDHTRRSRDTGSRVNSAWFGQSAQLKKKALENAIEFAEAA